MTESAFESVEQNSKILKSALPSKEFAAFAESSDFSEEAVSTIAQVISYLGEKKVQTTIRTFLKMSKLPLKIPKAFENFDFNLIRGRDVDRLRALPSLAALYAHRNLAFIDPTGMDKTHLAQAFDYESCQKGFKNYFIKMSELRDKFTATRRVGNEHSVLNRLVRPSCLIIDEVGHCEFDKENPRLFFELVDRRYNRGGHYNMVFTSNEDDSLLCSLDWIFDEATVSNIHGESDLGKKLEKIKL